MATKYLLNAYQGDTDYSIQILLLDIFNNPVDLSGFASGTLSAQLIDTINQSVTFSGPIAVVGDPTLGQIAYGVKSGDLDIAGIYDAVVNVVYGSGQIASFGDIAISVKPRIAIS